MNHQPLSSCKSKNQNVGKNERIFSILIGLAILGKALRAENNQPAKRLLGLIGATGLVYRGITGNCSLYQVAGISTCSKSRRANIGINLHHTIEINRPKETLYSFWRDLENIPRFMYHIKKVHVLDEKHSEWNIDSRAGIPVSWKAEITAEKAGEYIAWQSLPDSEIATTGSVQFKERTKGATEVILNVRYRPPLGRLGKLLYTIIGSSPDSQVKNDLRRFKQLMETGEIATTKGQTNNHRQSLSITKTLEERAKI